MRIYLKVYPFFSDKNDKILDFIGSWGFTPDPNSDAHIATKLPPT